jgi:hypothetical protein
MRKLLGCSVLAEDGESGLLHDLYFDDQIWIVRYFVVQLGDESSTQKALIPPAAFRKPDEKTGRLPVKLTRARIEYNLSGEAYREQARWTAAEDGEPCVWLPKEQQSSLSDQRTLGMSPDAILEIISTDSLVIPTESETRTINLQSGRAVSEYQFQAQDGQIGQIEDFIVNDETWGIYYLVVDTGCWRPGQKVLISPFSLSEINPAKARVLVNLNWEVIQNGPRYERSRNIEPEYQRQPYRYYARPKARLQPEQRHILPI